MQREVHKSHLPPPPSYQKGGMFSTLFLLFSLTHMSWRYSCVTATEFELFSFFFLSKHLGSISQNGKMDVPLYNQTPTDRCLGGFRDVAITNIAAGCHFFPLWVGLWDKLPKGVDGQRELIYNFDRYCQITLHCDCTHVHSCQLHRKVLVSQEPCQQREFQCSFNLLVFLWPMFSLFSLHPHLFFFLLEVSIHILHVICPYFIFFKVLFLIILRSPGSTREIGPFPAIWANICCTFE